MDDEERTLTDAELARQDQVDNAIRDLLSNVLNSPELEWDIELIGDIRDDIEWNLVTRGLITEQEFYPFIPIED